MEHLDEACRIGNCNAGRVNVAQRNGSDRALPGTRQRLRRGAELLGGDWDETPPACGHPLSEGDKSR